MLSIGRDLVTVMLVSWILVTNAFALESPTLNRIRETGVVVVAYRIGAAPFSYLDDSLKPIGYSMDLCYRIVDAVGTKLKLPNLKTKLIAVTAATRIPLVANGTVDLECGATTNTLERQKIESFTVTTFVARSRLAAKKSSGIRSLNDLRGKPVVSTVGTTSIQYLHEINVARRLGMKILAGRDDAESFQMVETDRAVAYAMDDVLLYGLVAGAKNPAEFSISDDTLSVEPYAIALSKDDAPFKKLVDDVIIQIFKSGEIYSIYRKWFLSPIPPKGVNLQLPMSPALKRLIGAPIDSSDPKLYD